MEVALERITEIELRHALRRRLSSTVPACAFVIEEMQVDRGLARVDIAVVDDMLTGYEIKSDFDSLDRLANQMNSYNRVFDELWIVTTSGFVEQVGCLLPTWWGILRGQRGETGDVELHVLRSPSANPRQDALTLLTLLWRDEAAELLVRLTAERCKARLARPALVGELATLADLTTVRDWVSRALKGRNSGKGERVVR